MYLHLISPATTCSNFFLVICASDPHQRCQDGALKEQIGLDLSRKHGNFLQSLGVHFFSNTSASTPIFLSIASSIFASLLSSYVVFLFDSSFHFLMFPVHKQSLFPVSCVKFTHEGCASSLNLPGRSDHPA